MKNVIFDLGKVLIDYDFSIFLDKLGCGDRSLSEADIVIRDFDAGLISREVFYLSMKNVYPHNLSQVQFENAWKNVFSEMTEMIELAKRISQKYKVYILSNTDEIHFPFIWNKFPSLHFFGNNLMLSYKLKAVKPEQEIFEKALRIFNLKPSECIFIDDRIENIEAAERASITSFQYISYQNTKKLFMITI